ncbi:hypothetical protein BH10CHL1_BH10CHL1_47980 [soil metagenome]
MARLSYWSKWWRNPKQQQGENFTTLAQSRAQQAVDRAKQRAFRQQSYHRINGLFHFNQGDFIAFLKTAAKWTLLGSAVGLLAGTASAFFLISLAWATQTRLNQPWLLYLLPLAGCGVGWVYAQFGGAAALGNNLVIDEVNNNQSKIPLRMAPLVLFGTIMTHLFGGSAGREGTAIQMGASLADNLQRWLRLNASDRRLMIMAGISGGFGSIFGVPAAGFVFGMEVQSVGRIRYEGMIPCLVAAYVGDLVTRAWGATHTHYPTLANLEIAPLLLIKVALAGVIFGLTSILFVELTHGIKQLMRQISHWSPLYPIIGGVTVIGLTLLLETRDYLGLSLPLIQQSVSGAGVASDAFLWKLIFTAITLGTGYLGGEVTPLFVIGSTLGYTLGHLLGIDPAFLASIGLVAVFAGASNTPLACAIMGIEIFGGGSPLYLFLCCTIAYLASGHRGIYVTQSIGSPKTHGIDVLTDESLRAFALRRGGGWLPRLPGLLQPFEQKSVKTLMTQPAIAVQADLPLDQAIKAALANGVRALPVINAQNQVVGMITDNDLRRSGLFLNLSLLQKMTQAEQNKLWPALHTLTAQTIMTQPALTLLQTANLAEAIQLLDRNQLKRLPVVDQAGQLTGLITRSDILREIAFADQSGLFAEKTGFFGEARLSELMLEPVTMLAATAPLSTLLESLRTNGQPRTLVTDAVGKASGMITTSDLLTRLNAEQRTAMLAFLQAQPYQASPLSSLCVADVMTTPIITIAADSPVHTALRLLMVHQIKRLPVVAPDGQVLGLVGRARLFQAFAASRAINSHETSGQKL